MWNFRTILLWTLVAISFLLALLWLYIYFFAVKKEIKKEKNKRKHGKKGLKT